MYYLDFNIYYNSNREHIGELCCSKDNLLIPCYAIENALFRQNANIFYTKEINLNFNIENTVRKLYLGLNSNRVGCRFSYPNEQHQYFVNRNMLFIFDNDKIVILMLLTVLSDKISTLTRYNNDPSDFKLLVNKQLINHKKLYAYMNKTYIKEISESNVDIIYTYNIDEYCFKPYQFPVSIKTLEELNYLSERVKYDLRELPVPALQPTEIITEDHTVQVDDSSLQATMSNLETEFNEFLISEEA